MKKSLSIAIGLVSLLGIAACSSDNNSLSVTTSNSTPGAGSNDTSATDGSATGGTSADSGAGSASVPDLSGVSLPAGFGDCSAYLSAFAGAISGQDSDLGNLSGLFDALDGKVPSDVNNAVKVLSKNFAELQKLYGKYNNDFSKIATDPAFTALFSNAEFTDASAKFNAWITAGCPMS